MTIFFNKLYFTFFNLQKLHNTRLLISNTHIRSKKQKWRVTTNCIKTNAGGGGLNVKYNQNKSKIMPDKGKRDDRFQPRFLLGFFFYLSFF